MLLKKRGNLYKLIPVVLLAGFFLCLCSHNKKQGSMETKKMSIKKEFFGETKDGEKIDLYTLTNGNQMTVKITNYGGIVTSILVPGKKGETADVVLGFDSLDGYLGEHPYFGAIVGRYGNRIAKGKFTLDGNAYTLAVNNGNHHLHGGSKGFDKVVWQAEEIKEDNRVGIKLRYLSKDGEEGYPGNLSVTVIYSLTETNELKIDYEAETDKATPINLTHHSYFNLEGAGSGNVLGHMLTIYANRYTPVDDELIPAGESAAVPGTPMDFRNPTAIGAGIEDVKGGYDHNYVLNNADGSMRLVAKVAAPLSGRLMDVFTTEPGIQFYSGNFLDGSNRGKNGNVYNKYYGFCLETQHFPDSPNQPAFPSTILRPGEKYSHHTIYKFYTLK
jgi:aldose 1-epimerase